jgi:hypothetical protein
MPPGWAKRKCQKAKPVVAPQNQPVEGGVRKAKGLGLQLTTGRSLYGKIKSEATVELAEVLLKRSKSDSGLVTTLNKASSGDTQRVQAYLNSNDSSNQEIRGLEVKILEDITKKDDRLKGFELLKSPELEDTFIISKGTSTCAKHVDLTVPPDEPINPEGYEANCVTIGLSVLSNKCGYLRIYPNTEALGFKETRSLPCKVGGTAVQSEVMSSDVGEVYYFDGNLVHDTVPPTATKRRKQDGGGFEEIERGVDIRYYFVAAKYSPISGKGFNEKSLKV